MMDLVRSLFCLLMLATLYDSSTPSQPSANIQTHVRDEVSLPYANAYRILREYIVNPLFLASANIDQSDLNATAKATSLFCAALHVLNQMRQAKRSCEHIREDIERRIAQLTYAVEQSDSQEFSEATQAIQRAQWNLQVTERQLQQAENAQRRSRDALVQAADEVAEVEERTPVSTRGTIADRSEQSVATPTPIDPSAQNDHTPRTARRRLEVAERNYLEQSKYVSRSIVQLSRHRRQHVLATRQRIKPSAEQQTLELKLTEARNDLLLVAALEKLLSEVNSHLEAIQVSSLTLNETIADIIDFEAVIEPLSNIHKTLIQYGVIRPVDFKISFHRVYGARAHLEDMMLNLDYSNVLWGAHGCPDFYRSSSTAKPAFVNNITSDPHRGLVLTKLTHGGMGGDRFDDRAEAFAHLDPCSFYLSKIIVTVRLNDTVLNSLELFYTLPNVTDAVNTTLRGNTVCETTSDSFALNTTENEQFSKINGMVDTIYGTPTVVGIQFYTNLGRSSPWYGQTNGSYIFTERHEGYTISFVSGRAGDSLDQLRFHWCPSES